jgi:hypothetical protein
VHAVAEEADAEERKDGEVEGHEDRDVQHRPRRGLPRGRGEVGLRREGGGRREGAVGAGWITRRASISAEGVYSRGMGRGNSREGGLHHQECVDQLAHALVALHEAQRLQRARHAHRLGDAAALEQRQLVDPRHHLRETDTFKPALPSLNEWSDARAGGWRGGVGGGTSTKRSTRFQPSRR